METVALVERAISHYQEQQQPRNIGLTYDSRHDRRSAAMQDVFHRIIGRLSRSSISVLINGESGPVKNWSPMRFTAIAHAPKRRLSPLNMAAIEDLIESELFGHEKALLPGRIPSGGAVSSRLTAARAVSGSGDMPLDVRTRLRVL